MSSRRTRSRRTFGIESLEIRTAPSHVSALAHAFVHLSSGHSPAHVARLNTGQAGEKSHVKDNNNTTTDKTPDGHVDAQTSDPTNHDSGRSDPGDSR
jgi:hypothetical protein